MIEAAVAIPDSLIACAASLELLTFAFLDPWLVKLIIEATRMMSTTVMPRAITSAIPSSRRSRLVNA
jgi:hypothetical protein